MGKSRSRKRKLFHQKKQNEETGRVDNVASEEFQREDSENGNDNEQLKEDNDSFSIRDISSLYVSRMTHRCATVSKCVSCAYKCCCFDVALDASFTSKVPNVRPEMCPRASSSKNNSSMMIVDVENGKHDHAYSSGMNVLTVGDGDFSFSLAIARQILSSSHNNTTSNLVATSYEDEATLRRVYDSQTFANTLNELHQLGATVLFKIDATRLYECNEILDRPSFHRIVWNFPCAALPNGQDGQNKEMELNRYLIQSFIQDNVLQYNLLDPICGEIHMAHKTKPPYNQWKLDELVLSSSSVTKSITTSNRATTKNNVENNHDCNLKNSFLKKQEESDNDQSNTIQLYYHGRVVLDKCLYPPYTPRKALDRKSFPCHDACIYIFGMSNNDINTDNETNQLFKHTINIDTCRDIEKKNEKEKQLLIPVTKEIITNIRNLHLLQAEKKNDYSNKRRTKRSKK